MGCLQSQYYYHHLCMRDHAVLVLQILQSLRTSQLPAELLFLKRIACSSPGMAFLLSNSYYLIQNMIVRHDSDFLHILYFILFFREHFVFYIRL